MTFKLSKYNANGNDFVLFHTFLRNDYASLARTLCHRHSGIGADGLIVLVPHADHAYEWLFYNADGSTASMCGNGSRACAHYAFSHGLASAHHTFLTNAGAISAKVEGSRVEVELTAHHTLAEPFEEAGFQWHFYDTGVPHLVALVEDVACFDKECARMMRHKYNANVNFAAKTPTGLSVRTFERGVEDETGACGTGMCASYLAMCGDVDTPVTITPTSGESVQVRLVEEKLFFKGNVHCVYETAWEESSK